MKGGVPLGVGLEGRRRVSLAKRLHKRAQSVSGGRSVWRRATGKDSTRALDWEYREEEEGKDRQNTGPSYMVESRVRIERSDRSKSGVNS